MYWKFVRLYRYEILIEIVEQQDDLPWYERRKSEGELELWFGRLHVNFSVVK